MIPSQTQPWSVSSAPQVPRDPHEGARDRVTVVSLDPTREDSSDEGDESTDYYTDQPPDSPLDSSPSPSPVGLLTSNHSYEGHSDHEVDPPSQSTVRPRPQSGDEENRDERTPRRKSKLHRRDSSTPESPVNESDEELDALRSELSSQIIPSTPQKLKPDPFSGWSPAKRKIMILMGSKTPGEEVDVKRSLSEGMSKLEIR